MAVSGFSQADLIRLGPDEIERKRKLAEALLASSASTAPIGHWTQGAARLAQALSGKFQQARLDKAEKSGLASAEQASNAVNWGNIYGGSGGDNRFTVADTNSSGSGGFSSASAPSSGAHSGSTNVSDPDIFNSFMETVKEGGVSNPYGLAAIAATGKHESGFSPKNVYGNWADPSESGRQLTAGGAMSWNGPRYEAMKQFVAANGGDPNKPDPRLQARYFLKEDPQLITALNQAKSPEEAQTLMNNAWRFAGYNRPGGEAARRISTARGFAGQFEGQSGQQQAPVQVASLDPSAGMNGDAANPYLPSIAPGLPRTSPSVPMPANQMQPLGGASPQPNPAVSAALQPPQGNVGVGNVPAGAGGQPVLDVTQMPQLSAAAGLPFLGAPQQRATAQPANPVAQALIKGGQGQLSPEGLAAHDKALGGILASNSGQATPQAQKIAQTLLGRGQGQNYFPPAPDPNRPDFAPQQQPAPQDNVQQLMAVINHPYATREQKMMAANALQQIQQRNDPANQLDLELKRTQLEALKAKPTTKYGFTTLPDGTVLRTNEVSGAAEPIYQGGEKPTTDIQNYEYYVRKETEAGRQPLGPMEYERELKRAGATNINNNNGTTTPDGDFRKKLDENEGKQWSDYKTTGTVSAGMNQDFQVLGELMKVAPQGPITGRLAEAFPGVSSAGDAFQSIVKRIAPTLRAPGSGSTSDIEYDGMLRSLPSLKNSSEANQMILSIMQAKQQLNVKRAGIITDYQSNKLNIDQAREAMQQLDSQSILTPEIKTALEAIGPQPSKGDATPAPEGVGQGVWDHMTPEERKLWQN